ncbi:hypothetical protein [Spirillospora albida]|uniref:hypothetical protein n=1 Tax=Spirillospora albida TaxID=58123 RepID=UPI00068DBD40|nr:hypothetical protein [Spirillospora albida]
MSERLSPEQQNALLEDITLVLVHTLPAAWQESVIVHRAVGSHSETLGQVRKISGPGLPSLWTPPPAVAELFARLRSGMHEEGLGTWFSAKFRLTFPFTYQIEYNRADEPTWAAPPPAEAYADELRLHPRAPEHIPSWLQKPHGHQQARPQEST